MKKITFLLAACILAGLAARTQSLPHPAFSAKYSPDSTVTDIDGNVYRIVKIANLVWMAENLKTTKFNDGSPIPLVSDNKEWGELTSEAYCWYDNDEETYKNEYGALYNYHVVMNTQNICPADWRIPTPAEWATLPCSQDYPYPTDAGHYHQCSELLAAGCWEYQTTNETDFTALPGGVRQGINYPGQPMGRFAGLGYSAFFWQANGEFYYLLEDYGIAFQEWFFFPSQFDGYSIRCIEDKQPVLTFSDMSTIRNTTFEIPVFAYNLPSDEVISYQFDLKYNAGKIQYQNYNLEGTMSINGNIEVNQLEDRLSLAWAGQEPMNDSGTIIKLRFTALEAGSVMPVLTNCLVNTDTVTNIENGTITINPGHGDVDGNGTIQAYDAAIVLQYSVGLDPLPDIDTLPWEDWRIKAGNVDGQNDISAYDASLILQYTVGLIDSFPVVEDNKSAQIPQSTIAVTTENGYLVFRSAGDLFGLNVTVEDGIDFLGEPQILYSGMLSAINSSSSRYSIGLATAFPPEVDEIIMKIPIINPPQQTIIDLKINTTTGQLVLSPTTGIVESFSNSIEMYPNPANTILYFKNLDGEVSVSVYDLQGRLVISGSINSNQINIEGLDPGLYTIHIEDYKNTKTGLLFKK